MRKLVILCATGVLIMLLAPCFAYALPAVTDGLVGCWNFDQGSMVTAMDTSGNGNDGTMVNTVYSTAAPGTSSTASLYFNNTQAGNAYSYVTIPDKPGLRPNSSLTLAAWVKTNSTSGRLRDVVSKQYGGGQGDSFVIWYHDDGRLWFACSVGSINAERPSNNVWHYIVATYNGSSMQLYVDGVVKASGSASGQLLYDDSPVLIGADCNNANHIPDEGWEGEIDEVLIYNRALSPAEILQIIPEFPVAVVLLAFMMVLSSAALLGSRRLKHLSRLPS